LSFPLFLSNKFDSKNIVMEDLNEIDNSQSSIPDGTYKTYRLPWSKYDNIFKIIDLKEDFERYQKFNVRCKYCASSKLLTADTRTSSNLLKHLEVSRYLLATYIM